MTLSEAHRKVSMGRSLNRLCQDAIARCQASEDSTAEQWLKLANAYYASIKRIEAELATLP